MQLMMYLERRHISTPALWGQTDRSPRSTQQIEFGLCDGDRAHFGNIMPRGIDRRAWRRSIRSDETKSAVKADEGEVVR